MAIIPKLVLSCRALTEQVSVARRSHEEPGVVSLQLYPCFQYSFKFGETTLCREKEIFISLGCIWKNILKQTWPKAVASKNPRIFILSIFHKSEARTRNQSWKWQKLGFKFIWIWLSFVWSIPSDSLTLKSQVFFCVSEYNLTGFLQRVAASAKLKPHRFKNGGFPKWKLLSYVKFSALFFSKSLCGRWADRYSIKCDSSLPKRASLVAAIARHITVYPCTTREAFYYLSTSPGEDPHKWAFEFKILGIRKGEQFQECKSKMTS